MFLHLHVEVLIFTWKKNFENANIQCLFLFCSFFMQYISKYLNWKFYLWEMKIFLLFIFQIMKLTQKKIALALVGNPTSYKIRHNLYNSEVWSCLWKHMPSTPPTQSSSSLLATLLALWFQRRQAKKWKEVLVTDSSVPL